MCDGRSVIFALKIIFKEINHIDKISIGFTLTSQFPGKFFSGYLISALNKPQGKPVHVQYLQQNKEVLKTIVWYGPLVSYLPLDTLIYCLVFLFFRTRVGRGGEVDAEVYLVHVIICICLWGLCI